VPPVFKITDRSYKYFQVLVYFEYNNMKNTPKVLASPLSPKLSCMTAKIVVTSKHTSNGPINTFPKKNLNIAHCHGNYKLCQLATLGRFGYI